MLKFIGSGSAFNTELGNTSAYIKEDDKLFLIDCGELTFKRILELNLLDNVTEVNIAITHCHSDHVGSLSSLILYCYCIKGFKPNLYIPNTSFVKLISLMGVNEKYCNLSNLAFSDITILQGMNLEIGYINSNHCNEDLDNEAYSIFIGSKKGTIFYSGDSCEVKEDILDLLKDGSIDIMYQDTCNADYKGNVHLSLRKLCEAIPEDLRGKVWCMHLDSSFNRKEAEELGFNVVKNVEVCR